MISLQDNKYQNGFSGATATKYAAEDRLINVMIKMRGALSVYGRRTGNTQLAAMSAFTETEIREMRDSDFPQKC